MARKANTASATPTDSTAKRNRRTPDQIVADLQAKIAAVQRRAAAQATRAAPEIGAFMTALKTIDRAIAAAEGNAEVRRPLEAARVPLAEQLERMGLTAPRKRVKAGSAA